MDLTDQQILEALQKRDNAALGSLALLLPSRPQRRAMRRSAGASNIQPKNAAQRRKARRQAGRRSAARNRR